MRRQVRTGYAFLPDLRAEAARRGAALGADPAHFLLLLDLIMSHQLDREAGWTSPTPNDRLEDALRSLEGIGIACLQNLAHPDEATTWATNEFPLLGVAFFNENDVDEALAGEGLMLHTHVFSPENETRERTLLGELIADQLSAHQFDFTTEPEGLRIRPFEWRRRQGS